MEGEGMYLVLSESVDAAGPLATVAKAFKKWFLLSFFSCHYIIA